MLSSHSHSITDFLRKYYPDEFITFKLIPYNGEISVFVFLFEQESHLETKWDKISGNIAGNYQSELTDDFAMWNVYLFYLCRSALSLGLKYKIENDRFSSRKIVLDNYTPDISDVGINDIVREHITNMDIKYNPETNKKEVRLDADTDPVIWELVKDVTLKPGRQSVAESEELLSKIEKQIRDEDKQG